jgi:hypothetical protein
MNANLNRSSSPADLPMHSAVEAQQKHGAREQQAREAKYCAAAKRQGSAHLLCRPDSMTTAVRGADLR